MSATLRTRTELENAIIAWIVLVHPTGRAILGWPTAPRPALPYLSARITAITPIGQDDRGPLDDAGVQTIYGDRLVTVTLNAFGAGALDLIRALANSIWRQTISTQLLAAGLCPQMPGPINDLTAMLETSAEERAHVEMRFGIKDIYTDDVGWIEHVEGTGVVKDPADNELTISFAADLD